MLIYKRKRHLLFVCRCSEHGWLRRKCRWIGSISVMKRAALAGVLVLLTAFLLAACTSPANDTMSGPSSSQSAAAVPGETMSDDGRYAPGPMGSSSVRW
jgi:predicted small secreted protein